MLKVIYSETGQYLEHSFSTIPNWLRQQRQLAARLGHQLFVEECTATFLLPATHDVIAGLQWIQRQSPCSHIAWAYAEVDTIEVVLSGLWVSPWVQNHEGTFLSDLDDLTSLALLHLWSDVARRMSIISR